MQKQKKCEEKNAFEVVLDGPLDGAIKGAPEGTPEGTPEGAPKVSLSDLHKDVQESAFEVAPRILL